MERSRHRTWCSPPPRVAPLLLVACLTASHAHAAVDVAWDCFLPSAQVACTGLEAAFFSTAAYRRAADPTAARAILRVRAVPISQGISYTIAVVPKDGAAVELIDRIPSGFDENAALVRLVGDLQRASVVLFVVDNPGQVENGALTLRLRDPSEKALSLPPANDTTRWYVAPSVDLSAQRYGVTQVSGRSALAANWSHPAWRLAVYNWASYLLIIADPSPGADPASLKYENVDLGTDWTLVRSLGDHFSLASNAYAIRDPQENYTLRAGMWVGAEWSWVQFMKVDEGNFGVHTVFGPEHHEYVYPSVLATSTLEYMRARAKIFATWHFSRIDVSGAVEGTTAVPDVRFSYVTGSTSAAFRILDDLTLSLTGQLSYRNALINEPKDLTLLHPLEQFYGGGAYGDVTLSTSLGLAYTFGNALLARQDQRWAN